MRFGAEATAGRRPPARARGWRGAQGVPLVVVGAGEHRVGGQLDGRERLAEGASQRVQEDTSRFSTGIELFAGKCAHS